MIIKFRAMALLSVGFLLETGALQAREAQRSFSSGQEAVQAAIAACAHNDTSELLQIFGPDGKDIVESGDRRQDKEGRATFAILAQQKNTLIPDPMNPNKIVLSIGNDDWPFPIPIVRKDGRWRFDSSEGRQEILARRIGENEMNAIEICRAYVHAQFEYAQSHRQNGIPVYATKIVSSPGKQDGLYWENQGTSQNAVPRGFAKAAASMSKSASEPYHGYYFKVLTAQGPFARGGTVSYVANGAMIGGFALVAWPAQYGVSGIETFIVNHDDNVFEKHLGPDTAKIAGEMTEFNPDASWRPAQVD